jgi:NAD(P)-dependent dehydrogenase (short-subunit alcohol dehydrogenase family)
LFTSLLLPKLRSAGPGARIVNVSSSAHRFEGIRFDDLDFKVSMTNSSRSLHFKSF